MSVIRLAALVAISSVLSVSAVFGQNLRNVDGPAETPPSSFSAAQYVDSKGCVFVRAGFAGQVQWVPRVSRSRKLLCGMQPSLAAAAPQPARTTTAPAKPRRERVAFGRPLPTVALTNEPPRIGTAAQARQAAAAAAAAATAREAAQQAERARQAQAAAQARRAATAARRAAPQPAVTVPRTPNVREARVIIPQTAPVRTARVVEVTPRVVLPAGNGDCTNRSAVGARYTNSADRNVRCGPQSESPVGNGVVYSNPKADRIAKTASRKKSKRGPAVLRIEGAAPRIPKGYRRVWDDGRLNPKRGLPKGVRIEGTNRTSGIAWTATLPRRLIDLSTGRDVTAQYPGLRYPNIRAQGLRSVISTKSPKLKRKPFASTARYVQIGTFGVAANADRTAAKMQSIGLPVRFSKTSRDGKSLRIVLAGPFSKPSQLNAALSEVRRAGFSDAFAR